MKKIILFLSFFAFLTQSSAQDLKNFRLGLIFSNNLMFPSSDNTKIKSIPSYDFDYGLSVDYFFTENYALSSGVYMEHAIMARNNGMALFADSTFLASDFAVEKNITSNTANYRERITAMHLNIPLSFKLKTNEIGYFKYFGDIGVLNSFRIQSRYSLEDTEIQKVRFGKKSAELNNINYKTNLYNFSIKVGGGFEDVIEDSDAKATYVRKLSLRTGIMF